jgi:hypothetical protein
VDLGCFGTIRESADFVADAVPEGRALPLAVPSAIASARRHKPHSQLTVLAEHEPRDLADIILFHAISLRARHARALTWIKLREDGSRRCADFSLFNHVAPNPA